MKQILVVEDDPIIMNLIVILLEREGYTVVQATSAEEGISLANAGPPDLILMDVALPGLDGLEATRILKEAESTSGVPVIALTAQARKEDEERALRAGCDGFLRVLQEGEIRRVGSASMRRVDVRILASTNRGLPTLIREGKFREDLFYRLNVIPIVFPPLRERIEDIVPLCRHLLTMYGLKLGREPQRLSSEALEVILKHGWPGNIRELENVIARVVTLSPAPVISAEEFPSFSPWGARFRPNRRPPPRTPREKPSRAPKGMRSCRPSRLRKETRPRRQRRSGWDGIRSGGR